MFLRRPYLASGMALGLLLAGAFGTAADAQVGSQSTLVPVALSATASDALTIMVQSGATQTIPSLTSNAVNPFPTPVQVYTEWNLRPLGPGGASLSLVAYFSAPTQALVSGANAIPASQVEARVITGALPSFTPITGNGVGGVGVNGGSAVLWTQVLCNSNACRNSQRTDNVDLQLNLTGTYLPVGTYSGTLNLRAVTY